MSFLWGYLYGHSEGKSEGYREGIEHANRQSSSGVGLSGLLVMLAMLECGVFAVLVFGFMCFGGYHGFGLHLHPAVGLAAAALAMGLYLALHASRSAAILLGLVLTPLYVSAAFFGANPTARCDLHTLTSLMSLRECATKALHPTSIPWGWMLFVLIAAVVVRVLLHRWMSWRWRRVTDRRNQQSGVTYSKSEYR